MLDRAALLLGPLHRGFSRRPRRIEPRIEPPRVPKLIVLEHLTLDAERHAVVAPLEQDAVVPDEELVQQLARLADAQARRRLGFGFSL